MPFNAAGTYTLSDTIANATSADATELQAILDDISTALNLTFLRNGTSVATGQFLQVVGATAAYSFSGDANTGLGSDTGDEAWLMGGGVKTLKANATGVVITGTLAPTGLATFTTMAVTSTSTFSDTITSTSASAGFVGYEAICTEAGAAAGPIVSLYRNSASPAASDNIGQLQFNGKDSGGNKTTYAYIVPIITDPTNGSEDADIYFNTLIAGVDTTVLRSNGANIAVPGALAVTGAISGSNIKAMTKQYLTSGTAATYTTPSSPTPKTLVVKMIGAGGGGGAATSNNGGTGGTTSFNSIDATGGSGGITSGGAGGAGGTGGSGSAQLRLTGGRGGIGVNATASAGGNGGNGAFGGGAGASSTTGQAGAANTGGGGGGGQVGGNAGGGGGAGEYVELVITSPSATYTYTIGAAGAAGSAGGQAGGAGGTGLIIVEEYY